MLTDIKLLAFDLDNTTLDSRKVFRETTRAALRRAMAAGVWVVPASGRGFTNLREETVGIPEIRYCICSNGARVVDGLTGRTLFSRAIPGELAARVIEALYVPGCVLYVELDDGHDTNLVGARTLDDFHAVLAPMHWEPPYVADIAAEVRRRGCDVLKVGTAFTEEAWATADVAAVAGSVSPELTCTGVDIRQVQVCAAGSGKGPALRALCAELGISTAQACAIGDGSNDLGMIGEAGLGVAMGNAERCVLEAADLVIGTCDEDGVAHFVDEVLLA